jgi:hypothetical protein
MIGTLQKIEFGSGGWKLVCENGQEYELVGEVPISLEGKKVTVTGSQESSYGFIMSGLPQISVERIVPA